MDVINELLISDASGIGHNRPSLEDELAEECEPLIKRRDQLIAAADRIPAIIENEEMCGRVADMVRLIAACIKIAESTRMARKEPFLLSGRAIDTAFKRITDPLEKSKKAIEGRLTAYQRAQAEAERRRREEEARQQVEEAARQRQLAEEAAATATTEADLETAIVADRLADQAAAAALTAQKVAVARPADMSRTRGDYGAVASLRTFWSFADLDRAAIDLEMLRPYLATDAIEKAIRLAIRAGIRNIRGCRIFEDVVTTVR